MTSILKCVSAIIMAVIIGVIVVKFESLGFMWWMLLPFFIICSIETEGKSNDKSNDFQSASRNDEDEL